MAAVKTGLLFGMLLCGVLNRIRCRCLKLVLSCYELLLVISIAVAGLLRLRWTLEVAVVTLIMCCAVAVGAVRVCGSFVLGANITDLKCGMWRIRCEWMQVLMILVRFLFAVFMSVRRVLLLCVCYVSSKWMMLEGGVLTVLLSRISSGGDVVTLFVVCYLLGMDGLWVLMMTVCSAGVVGRVRVVSMCGKFLVLMMMIGVLLV